MATTPKFSLRYPNADGSDLPAGHTQIGNLASDVESNGLCLSGPLAARPAANTVKLTQEYFATDVSKRFMSDGTNWREIAQAPVGVSQLGTDVPVVPIGTLLDYVGAADPADTRFLLADGRELNRTTYASLFSVMSTTYGTGNGTTTFNIPDCRGRTSVGPDNMGTANGDAARLTANDARGNSGGEEKHTLTTGELPSHTHRIAWTLINEGTGASFSVYTASGTPDANGTGTHRTEANDTPRGAAHNVMQPYIVLNKIIRVS